MIRYLHPIESYPAFGEADGPAASVRAILRRLLVPWILRSRLFAKSLFPAGGILRMGAHAADSPWAASIGDRIDDYTDSKRHPLLRAQGDNGVEEADSPAPMADLESAPPPDVIHADPGEYELVRIPGGTFLMGGEYPDALPVHEVHVPDFYMGRYPVTNREYARFLAANPKMEKPLFWRDERFNQPDQPVVGVSWKDACRYAEWAGLLLPSEAQWEYACRAGTTTKYYTGDSEADLARAGWYIGNSGKKLNYDWAGVSVDTSGAKLYPVGKKEPNAFGLYDMHGNVSEWVEDAGFKNYGGLFRSAPVDGSAWERPKDCWGDVHRVLRGGSWLSHAIGCCSGTRGRTYLDYKDELLGFRLVDSRPGAVPADRSDPHR